mgnify:CR=1 FL=1
MNAQLTAHSFLYLKGLCSYCLFYGSFVAARLFSSVPYELKVIRPALSEAGSATDTWSTEDSVLCTKIHFDMSKKFEKEYFVGSLIF